MSAPINSGTITANKPFTNEAVAIIEDILGDPSRSGCGGYALHGANIEFYEYYTYDLEEFLLNITDRLKPLGFTLTGCVEYFSDWGNDGRIDVGGGNVSSLSREEFALHDADDDTLIEILSQRGYSVTKNPARKER